MIDKILAIARHEWPKAKWKTAKAFNPYPRPMAALEIEPGKHKYFDPLKTWSDLMPLIVKYKLHIVINKDDEFWTAWAHARPGVYGNDLSESEYRRVAIEALYELLCAKVAEGRG